ncbi:DUF2301 domain-containing membrane protein [Alkalinema pantanalense CENA528]|uniref:DUF2301 domain-containing membrane protein n=1 Tax=Alkalinema pantanalense TaxID=1620705 RepID=UPI003D6F2469
MTSSAATSSTEPVIYQGQFGPFTIDEHDRQGVRIYRSALMVAAVCVALVTIIALVMPESSTQAWLIAGLYAVFSVALGISLFTIHIYLEILHRALQAFWAVGCIAAIAIALGDPAPFVETVVQQPWTILGIGFTFAALTGIYFKEAFCFNRLETKFLTVIVPTLLLGHLLGLLPIGVAQGLAIAWSGLFLVFAGRKAVQAIPDDIGDKSVFEYLHQQKNSAHQ